MTPNETEQRKIISALNKSLVYLSNHPEKQKEYEQLNIVAQFLPECPVMAVLTAEEFGIGDGLVNKIRKVFGVVKFFL